MGGVFGDPVVATAILDRLLHHSTVITIRGDSYRLREKRRSGLLQKVGTALETNETGNQWRGSIPRLVDTANKSGCENTVSRDRGSQLQCRDANRLRARP
jgi:hypothetical protein